MVIQDTYAALALSLDWLVVLNRNSDVTVCPLGKWALSSTQNRILVSCLALG